MKDAVLLVIAFFLGFGSVLGYRYIRTPKPATALHVPVTPSDTPQPTLSLEPPAQALSGILTVTKGHAEVFARSSDAYAEASTGAKILLGESVATKENSQAVIEITNFVTATMEEKAEVVFANLFANNMVLQQKNGKVLYKLADGVNPIAIRALHALVSLRSGETTINIIDTDLSVTVKSGSIKLALVDTDNNTKIWELKEDQRANIDDDSRTVRILKTR
jgi:hypothetical protein